jgi:hypothetical protein
MTTQQPEENHDSKIVWLTVAEDQSRANALARYWDAMVRGQSADPGALDPQLAAVVALLRHYHAVTRLPHAGTASPSATSTRLHPIRPTARAALSVIGVFAVIFALNTLLSPRSWLLSSAEDPDWIPWVSDDWLGADAVTAHVLDTRSPALAMQPERSLDGA